MKDCSLLWSLSPLLLTLHDRLLHAVGVDLDLVDRCGQTIDQIQ
jgi:hypothetical protein